LPPLIIILLLLFFCNKGFNDFVAGADAGADNFDAAGNELPFFEPKFFMSLIF